MREQKFGINSRENGLPDMIGKRAYPLHKQISENSGMETKYGSNGMKNSKEK